MPQPVRRTFATATVTIGLPALITTILALIAGALQVVNQLVLTHYPEWQGVIAVFLIFIVSIGITPATGPSFRTLLHLPPWAYTLVTAFIFALTGVLQIAGLPTAAHAVIATVLTVLAALGFGASAIPVAPPPKAVRATRAAAAKS